MRRLAHIARRYDRGYGHFTTRQNIQYNWIKLEEAPDILAELAEVEMHAIQTSGESIRNTSADQYAGAAADEVIDPRPWAETIRQMTTFMPEFSYLPRKFKIAVIATEADRAARQHPQAADEDPRPRARRGRVPPPGRGGVRALPDARPGLPAGRVRPHRGLFCAAAVRDRPFRGNRPL